MLYSILSCVDSIAKPIASTKAPASSKKVKGEFCTVPGWLWGDPHDAQVVTWDQAEQGPCELNCTGKNKEASEMLSLFSS